MGSGPKKQAMTSLHGDLDLKIGGGVGRKDWVPRQWQGP